jgi:hypothetical protein
MKNLRIYDNIAENEGGGLYMEEHTGDLSLDTVTFSANISYGNGGGALFSIQNMPLCVIVNTTVVNNASGLSFANLRLYNSLVWGNTYNIIGGSLTAKSNLIENEDGFAAGQEGSIFADYYGGDYRLASNSPAKNNGNKDGNTYEDYYQNSPGAFMTKHGITTLGQDAIDFLILNWNLDLDGNSRIKPVGGDIDIGAYERQ